MNDPLTPAERAAIASVHVPNPAYNGKYCQACGPAYGRWPCDAHELLATVQALEAGWDVAEAVCVAAVEWCEQEALGQRERPGYEQRLYAAVAAWQEQRRG